MQDFAYNTYKTFVKLPFNDLPFILAKKINRSIDTEIQKIGRTTYYVNRLLVDLFVDD